MNYESVLLMFQSIIGEVKYPLNADLMYQWFLNALLDFEINIGKPLDYNLETREFKDSVQKDVALILAKIMKVGYLEQQVSYKNKINNIITPDLTLNSTDSSKMHMANELERTKADVEAYFHKKKRHSYS